MDTLDRKIAAALARDARLSMAQIGAEVGLSTSAVNDRIRRLSARGAIRAVAASASAASSAISAVAGRVSIAAPQAMMTAAISGALRSGGASPAAGAITGPASGP